MAVDYGYGDKWPRKWLGIGRAFANWSQCTANAVPIQFDMLGIEWQLQIGPILTPGLVLWPDFVSSTIGHELAWNWH